jgi:hypothetical protein
MARRWLVVALVLLAPAAASGGEPFRYPEGTHGRGELKYRNGIPVLTVAGSPEEIGEQIGTLGLKPIAGQVHLVKEFTKDFGPAWPVLVGICEGLFRKFPPEYRREVEAMAKAAGVEREFLVVANTIGDVQHLGGCSAFIVGPSRSATGQVLFGRNWDFRPIGDLDRFSLLIVYRPAGKRSFASVSFPGLVFAGSEMNDAGLCLATNDARDAKDGSPRLDAQGTPLAVLGRRLMEECGSVADAEKLFKGLHATTTGLAIVCDTHGGAVAEVSPKTVAIRRAEDGLCACTNHFRTPDLATDTQCWRYEKLEQLRGKAKFTLADVAQALDAVNQGKWTMQSMVFEPAALRVHLAVGPGPVTKHPLRALDLGPLMKGEGK